MSRLQDDTLFSYYAPTWGDQKASAQDILDAMDDNLSVRLVGVMFEKDMLTPSEFIDVLRAYKLDYRAVYND